MRYSLVAALCGVALLGTLPARADIAVAVVGPMTGTNASGGEQLRNGAESAVADINAAGGVLGQKLVLTVADDACDPKQAVSVANQLAGRGVVFVDVGYCSGVTIAAMPVYAENNVLMITPAATNPAVTDLAARNGWINVYRTCGRDDQQAAVAAEHIAARYRGKRVFVVDDKSTYGKGLGDDVRGRLRQAGLDVVSEQVTAGERDYNALVSRLKQANPDLVYYAGYVAEAGLILRQMREQGLQAQFMGPDTLPTPDFWSITGPSGNGVLFTFGPDPTANPAASEIVAKLRARNISPEGYTLYSYAAMQVFAQAAAAAKSVKLQDLAPALRAGTFDTVIGPIQFDAKGDKRSGGYILWKWENGAYKPLGPG